MYTKQFLKIFPSSSSTATVHLPKCLNHFNTMLDIKYNHIALSDEHYCILIKKTFKLSALSNEH